MDSSKFMFTRKFSTLQETYDSHTKIPLCRQNVDLPVIYPHYILKIFNFLHVFLDYSVTRLHSNSAQEQFSAKPFSLLFSRCESEWCNRKSGEETNLPENRTGKALIIFRFNLPVFSFLLRRTFKSFCTSRLFIKDHLVTPFE